MAMDIRLAAKRFVFWVSWLDCSFIWFPFESHKSLNMCVNECIVLFILKRFRISADVILNAERQMHPETIGKQSFAMAYIFQLFRIR